MATGAHDSGAEAARPAAWRLLGWPREPMPAGRKAARPAAPRLRAQGTQADDAEASGANCAKGARAGLVGEASSVAAGRVALPAPRTEALLATQGVRAGLGRVAQGRGGRQPLGRRGRGRWGRGGRGIRPAGTEGRGVAACCPSSDAAEGVVAAVATSGSGAAARGAGPAGAEGKDAVAARVVVNSGLHADQLASV
ncbi:hypothetical protein C2845_PM08G23970 [Panicum miliaceum]|uniref:Uncharacterized protein n=1 Tax=Panicum miliaceum TaxID=4540 RepID=A0A3L6R2W4_PANMI|nr:hypothetical protein C2845_PM08G23970 [Panicum miliaceum]